MVNASASSCTASPISEWFAKFSLPDHVTSDRGTAFTLHLWTSLGPLLGTIIHHTTAYNPEAIGMVERLHKMLKTSLMFRSTQASWWVLFGLRTSSMHGLDALLVEMVYGDPLVIPDEFSPNTSSNEDLNWLRRSRKIHPLPTDLQASKPPMRPPSTYTHRNYSSVLVTALGQVRKHVDCTKAAYRPVLIRRS
ncbi:uncharacterized protein LOC143039788 [Oratosquilla oratoria]|uniref:uncharacterized protein LOC143039788 n=1 Tax=Oratosquilla oratoria TaxID=337810 RepID=UPI003F75DD3D